MINSEQKKVLTSWLSVIGAITLFWSQVERRIGQVVHALYRNQQESSKKQKPTTLRFKLIFIESNLPFDLIPKIELENLIKLTKKAVKIRNVCICGIFEEFDKDFIKVDKIQRKSDDHEIEVFTIDRNRFDNAAENLVLLNQRWGKLADSLIVVQENG